jgi:hypothetical protein
VVEEPIVASGTEEVAREQHHLRPRVCEWVDSVGSACCRAHAHTPARTICHSLRRTSSSGSCKICSISRIFRFGITCVRACVCMCVLVRARLVLCARADV